MYFPKKNVDSNLAVWLAVLLIIVKLKFSNWVTAQRSVDSWKISPSEALFQTIFNFKVILGHSRLRVWYGQIFLRSVENLT